MASTEEYILELRKTPMGILSVQLKIHKHLKLKGIREVRTYLACLKCAYPKQKIVDLLDPDLLEECRQLIGEYYVPNKEWTPKDGVWEVFKKIKEPPK